MALSADSSSLARSPATRYPSLVRPSIAAFGQPGDILLTLSANP